MATIIIKKVPANIGTAPKDPSAAAWPSLIGMKGYHSVLNKNSKIDTWEKKRKLSKINENIIPIVVKTAIEEQKIRIYFIYFSIVELSPKSIVSTSPFGNNRRAWYLGSSQFFSFKASSGSSKIKGLYFWYSIYTPFFGISFAISSIE